MNFLRGQGLGLALATFAQCLAAAAVAAGFTLAERQSLGR
jgi:hypothetical protein